ncbi:MULTISPECIES: acyltransferase family protein [Olivibacter]|uniref:Acyltransferase family protein n=2 Tax=Olivibacter TaxID=376469 RepID=A0ABV6HQB2_9SPHI|nr:MULTISPECIES: acyltransferase [Olivibacter]QEL03591.1 acyltransferase [Olivibacter sp. LS-1]
MYKTKPNFSLLKTKQHFEILDGLRGIAAIAVLIFHFMEIATPDYHDNFIAHSYLAVDFFFCLSGFVIAYAYDNKMDSIGFISFLKLRLIRLHPLVIIGSIIGLLGFLYDPFSDLYKEFSPIQIALMFASSSLLIPYPAVPERYFNLFHLNPPTWSLFWEYIANISYALFLYKFRNKILWCLTGIAALALCYEAYRSNYLGVGWGADNIRGGGIRISYSFLVGMLVYRSNWVIKNRLGFILLGSLLAITFFIPFSEKINWVLDPFIVIFYFPFLIVLGVGVNVPSSSNNICKFLGDISYPLYMIHYPFIWIFMSYVEQFHPTWSQLRIIVLLAVITIIIFAYFVFRVLDLPIRTYLKNKFKRDWDK